MNYIRVTLGLIALYLLSGCATNSATGNAIEVRLIEPSQEITVLWDIGYFDNSAIQNALLKNGTTGERFEACTNYFIEQAFLRQGYSAKARKTHNAELLRLPEIKTPYVLLLHNTAARGMKSPTITTLPSATAILTYEGRLHEAKRGRALWTVDTWLSTNPEGNAKFAFGLAEALAADGYLMSPPAVTPAITSAQARSQPLLTCPKNLEAP